MPNWLTQLKNAKKSSIVDGKLKKVHYDFENGQQMVEEYNLDTNVLTRRAWKCKTGLKSDDQWDIEIGEPEPVFSKDDLLIKEDSSQPFVTRRNTRNILEWRIRNLPYPIEVYSVTVDTDSRCLVVRTTNKKYFKKLPIPDLDRLNLLPQQTNVSFSYKFNTLIITYKKPKELLEFEKELWEELKQIKGKEQPNCQPS